MEERRLRVFENRMLRRISELERNEVTGEWRRLQKRSFVTCICHELLLG
jgi:hypothetical protein